MARNYKPSVPFSVPMKLLVPVYSNEYGATKKAFADPNDIDAVFFGSFRTFGGTERIRNDLYTLEDTATIDCWYDPSIKADCAIYLCDTGITYEIIGTPENIDMRNQYMSFKVRRLGGAA